MRLLQPRNEDELDAHCLSQRGCAIISLKGKLSEYQTRVVRDTMLKYRNITFAFYRHKLAFLGDDIPKVTGEGVWRK